MEHKLLPRSKFREAVLERDGHRCVICGRTDRPLDAHHIIERRLWVDGGYYLANGASLCEAGKEGCHYKAETTDISVDQIRHAIGFRSVNKLEDPLVPEDMYPDHSYDKWGNIIMEDGRRTKGPLFFDESVQKVLAGHMDEFTEFVKYPRTYHLPWSPGVTDDDRVLKSFGYLEGREVVVTRKMDGENFSGYRAHCHARSLDGRGHWTRDWAKSFWYQRSYELPEGWRIVAENVYAKHSIKYTDLPGYLLGISVWDEKNVCQSWDDTKEWFQLLDMPMVEELWRGTFDPEAIKKLHTPADDDKHEGYLVRLTDAFEYGDFNLSVAKYVRKNHVSSSNHWMHQAIEPNELAA